MNPSTPILAVKDVAKELRGKRVFYHALAGNNGDRLIDWGSRAILRDQKCILVDSEDAAECIVLNGGAAISKEWRIGINYLNKCNASWPDKPLWIFPSTVNIDAGDFDGSFNRRTSPAYFWARERYSLDIINKCNFPDSVIVGVDHDMAFQLRHEKFMDGLRAKLSEDYILIVERDDVESPTGNCQFNPHGNKTTKARPSKLRLAAGRAVPEAFKEMFVREPRRKKLRDSLTPEVWQNRPYVQAALQQIYSSYPETKNLPVRWWDVSKTNICSMQGFLDATAGAAVIATTRLHVGILGHMLGKRAYVTFGKAIPHKFKGIYELSLEQDPNIQVLPFSADKDK